MKLSERIDLLCYLGAYIEKGSELLDAHIQRAHHNNQWFTPQNVKQSLASISKAFLQKNKLTEWVAQYEVKENTDPKRIGLILAGNIPLVGFHDLLCVFISGHIAQVKLSDKDKILLPFLTKIMTETNADVKDLIHFDDRLQGFDAVIATGSNNSARYFESYFGKYPNIIRKNRNAVAILNGNETEEEFKALGNDIFQYFGLGCRNVSKLYVPKGYDFTPMFETLHAEHKEIVMHNKYKNNFDYNYTLLILNSIPHLSNGCVLLTEDDALQSRIAQVHYSFYENEDNLKADLLSKKEEIQCVIGSATSPLTSHAFGEAQRPGLMDYADGVDTMAFLTTL